MADDESIYLRFKENNLLVREIEEIGLWKSQNKFFVFFCLRSSLQIRGERSREEKSVWKVVEIN